MKSKQHHNCDKTFYIENLGCAKNQVDAETIIFILGESGWKKLEQPDEAALIIVNTCGFIADAKKESLDTVLDFRLKYPEKKILFAGCMAQRYAAELKNDLQEVDGIFGNNDLKLIDEVVELLWAGNRPVMVPDKPSVPETDALVSVNRKDFLSFPGSTYVKIAEGCNNRCSFCAIPLIRGDVTSRSRTSIVEEIKTLVAEGMKEINLIAQDLSAYGLDRGERDLVPLLKDISALDGDFWIRLLYIHPDNFDKELIAVMKADSRILPYFDLPFQHASERILKKMNRRGNPDTYSELVSYIRKEMPEAVVRSTFMAAFPGERKNDFRTVADFLYENKLNWVGFFVYSREENTPAYDMGLKFLDKRSKRVGEKRKAVLSALQLKITEEFLDDFVGKEYKVLIEEEIPEEDLYIGRTYFQAPDVDGFVVVHGEDLKPGEFINCRIIRRNGFDLEALPVEKS
jgi:ribosomal protein S12 methylthiotransferase